LRLECFAWTLLEYVIHGVLGHAHRTFVSGLHEVHHRDPRAVFALGRGFRLRVVSLVGGFFLGRRLACFSWRVAAGFAGYELIHYRFIFLGRFARLRSGLRARHWPSL